MATQNILANLLANQPELKRESMKLKIDLKNCDQPPDQLIGGSNNVQSGAAIPEFIAASKSSSDSSVSNST